MKKAGIFQSGLFEKLGPSIELKVLVALLFVAITSSAIADIAFEELKLVFEIDGRTYHGDERAFVRDRCRDAELAVRGWQVVRFAASDVFDDPARFAATVRRICQVRARQLCRQLT